MTAYDSATYYMLGVLFCVAAFVATVLGDRPWKWLELGACYAVVWPMLSTWRDNT